MGKTPTVLREGFIEDSGYLLPAEFSCDGYFDEFRKIPESGYEIAIHSLARWGHDSHLFLFGPDKRPITYLPCNADVCPTDPQFQSIAFFDDSYPLVMHLLFKEQTLRTFKRKEFESIALVSPMDSQGRGFLDTVNLRSETMEPLRRINSLPSMVAQVEFICLKCNFQDGAEFGGVIPNFTALKLGGCPACVNVQQVAQPLGKNPLHCKCGEPILLFDAFTSEPYRKEATYLPSYQCPACNKFGLRIRN